MQGYKIWLDNRLHRSRKERELRMEGVMMHIEIYLKTLANKYTEEVTDLQMPIIVNEFVGHMEAMVLCEAAASITRNDIANNKPEVEAKLEAYICNRYRDMGISLGRFKWKGQYLSEFIPRDKKDELLECTLDIVLKDKHNESQKLQSYRNLGACVKQRGDEIRQHIISKAYG